MVSSNGYLSKFRITSSAEEINVEKYIQIKRNYSAEPKCIFGQPHPIETTEFILEKDMETMSRNNEILDKYEILDISQEEKCKLMSDFVYSGLERTPELSVNCGLILDTNFPNELFSSARIDQIAKPCGLEKFNGANHGSVRNRLFKQTKLTDFWKIISHTPSAAPLKTKIDLSITENDAVTTTGDKIVEMSSEI